MSPSSIAFLYFFLPILFLISLILLIKKIDAAKKKEANELVVMVSEKRKYKQKLAIFYLESYRVFLRIPVLKGYVKRIRKRIETINSFDERTIRKETMRIAFIVLTLLCFIFIGLLLFSQSFLLIFYVLFAFLVVNGLLITLLVNRLEDRLLSQLTLLLGEVRHFYQQTKMVEEAIYEAIQKVPYEVSLHAEKIYDILTSDDPKGNVEVYYGVAPNRYLRAFAKFSFLTKELGDSLMYLDALSKLTEEINFEILKRSKTSALFKGMSAVALAPIFVVESVKGWILKNFPSLEDYFNSQVGVFSQVIVLVIIVATYVLIRKMQENDEESYKGNPKKILWEKKVYEIPQIKWVVDRLVPGYCTKKYFRLSMLLKDSNSPLRIEWLYVQRVLLAVSSFVIVISIFSYSNYLTITNVLYKPGISNFIGKVSERELANAQKITDFDRSVIQELDRKNDINVEDVITAIQLKDGQPERSPSVIKSAHRIYKKIGIIESTYFMWWYLLIVLLVSTIGFFFPVWLLMFRKRLRMVDMALEVEQFRTLISILIRVDRISVENILEELEGFAIIFKDHLTKALLHYDGGAYQALGELKKDVSFIPFVRIIDKLQMAVEKIPLQDAFDDLEIDREFYKKEREQHYEKVLREKVAWGELLALTPAVMLVMLYMVIPLIYISTNDLNILNTIN